MSPEKIRIRIRTILAQKLRFLRFTCGGSQEVLAEQWSQAFMAIAGTIPMEWLINTPGY